MAKKAGSDVLVAIGADMADFDVSLGSMFDHMKSAVTRLNPVLAGAVAVVALIGAAAFDVAKDYEEAFNTIRVATGANGPELEGLKSDFKSTFFEVEQDAHETAEAIGEINTRLGLTDEPLQKAAKGFLDLAAMMGEEVKPLIEDVSQGMKAWGIENTETVGTLDKLLVISQETGASVGDISGQLSAGAPILKQWGLSFDEAASMLGTFESNGVKSEQVISGLGLGLKNLAKDGIEPSKEKLLEWITAIQGAKNDADAIDLSVQMFGRSGAVLAGVIGDGKFSLDEYAEALRNSGGAVENADRLTDTLGERFGNLWKRVQDTLAPLGQFALFLGNILGEALSVVMDQLGAAGKIITKVFHGDFVGATKEADKALQNFKDHQTAARFEWDKYNNSVELTAQAQKKATEIEEKRKAGLKNLSSETIKTTRETKEHEKAVKDLAKQHKEAEAATERFKKAAGKVEAEQAAKKEALELKIEHERLATETAAAEAALESFWKEMEITSGISEDLQLAISESGGGLRGLVVDIDDAKKAAWAGEKALRDMGMTPRAELDELARNAADNFEKIRVPGVGTPAQIDAAWVIMMTARKTALVAAGTDLPAEEQKMLDAMLAKDKTHKADSHGIFSEWAAGVKSITGSLGTDVVTALFSGEGFGGITDKLKTIATSFKDVFVDKAQESIQSFIDRGMKWATDALDGLIGKLTGSTGVQGALDRVFGAVTPSFSGGSIPGVGGSGTSIPGVGGGSSGGATSGSSAASGAVGSITGWVTAIGSAVSAVTDVLGMFGVGVQGSMDRALEGMRNDTSYLAWVFSVGGQHKNLLDIGNYSKIAAMDRLPGMEQKLHDIQYACEVGRDRLVEIPAILERIAMAPPKVDVYVTLDGRPIAAAVDVLIGNRIALQGV